MWIQAGAADTVVSGNYDFSRMIYDYYSRRNEVVSFSAAEAKTLMLRPGSKLRTIAFANISYSVSGYFGQRFFPLHLAFVYLVGKMGACYA